MTAANFDAALKLILGYEGDFSDDSLDPGGATEHGITLTTLENYLGRTCTVAELKAIQPDLVSAIYRKAYWGATCDALPAGVDLMYFDAAVQHGGGKAAKLLQGAAGVTQDGMVGHFTLDAAAKANPSDTIRIMGNERDTFYRSLPTFATFGKGWMARLNNVTAQAYAWANLAAAK